VPATARGEVGAVTSRGRVLRLAVLDLPEVPGVTTGALSLRGGASATELASLERGERVLCLTTYANDSPGLVLASRLGVVKRVAPDWPGRLDVVPVVTLQPGDELVGATQLADGEEELVLFTSTGDLLRFPASLVRPQGRSAGGVAGVRLAAGASVVGFSAVPLGDGDALFAEPVVVTGAGLPPEKGPRHSGPGTVSSVKVTPLADYPRKGRATGGVRAHRMLSGESHLILGWAGPAPAWAAGAGGEVVELPPADGRRDGSGVPVDRAPTAVGRPYLS